MLSVTLYHPELGETVEVPEGTASVMRKSGWTDPRRFTPRRPTKPRRSPPAPNPDTSHEQGADR